MRDEFTMQCLGIHTALTIPVDNCINDNLNWVRVRQEVDDLHGVLDNSHSHQLLTIVSPVHHERVCEPLNNWALSLSEPLHRVSSSSVRDKSSVFRRLNTNVVNKTNVCDLHKHTPHDRYKIKKKSNVDNQSKNIT